MQAFQVESVSRFALVNRSRIDRAAALGRLATALVAAIVSRCTRGRHDAIPHYEGHAWCDSLERQLNSDTTTCRRARL
jgi:hypothetical protein